MSTSTQTPPSAPAAGAVTEATPRAVHEWLSKDQAILIDVREPDEHIRERIPGAHLLPLSIFDPQEAAANLKPGQHLVFHCRSGRRSLEAARAAAAALGPGAPLFSMTGGIEAWKKERLAVEVNRSAARLSIMRQVQLVVGIGTLIGAALAWFVHPAFIIIPAFFGAGLTFAGATGTCGLAALLGLMPWNRLAPACKSSPPS